MYCILVAIGPQLQQTSLRPLSVVLAPKLPGADAGGDGHLSKWDGRMAVNDFAQVSRSALYPGLGPPGRLIELQECRVEGGRAEQYAQEG